nr:arginine/serine-rich protein 1 [Misgurnus anguillicaudatus]
MKEEGSPSRRGEGLQLIFDQKAPSSRSSSRSSSSDSSASSSTGSRSSRGSRRSSRNRRRSRSSSSSDSNSSSRSRSRSHPRCHRVSSRSRCRHRHYSPPRRYRARSRSYSRSPDRSRRRYRRRSPSSSRSRSPPSYGYSRRSPSRSPVWRGSRFVGRYRCRFSRSPDRYRVYRSRSRSQERGGIRLSLAEKKYLLDVAKANAARILGVQNFELPASLKEQEERSSSVKEEKVRADPVPQKTQVNRVTNDDDHGEGTSQTSPKTKPITFSINNAVAKPSNSPAHHESKVTSRADSVADRKPYGQWVPIGTSSKNKH